MTKESPIVLCVKHYTLSPNLNPIENVLPKCLNIRGGVHLTRHLDVASNDYSDKMAFIQHYLKLVSE